MATVPATLPPLTREDRAQIAPRDDSEVLAEALARFKLCQEAESSERTQQLHALKFRAGEHVAPGTLSNGERYPAPLLTVDRQGQFIRQTVNSYRKSPLSVRVRPKSGGATKEVAEALEAHVRSIEQESEADIAYCTALDQAVGQGLGYFRLITDYDDPYSFTETIKIVPIFNALTVYMDPHATHPAALDAEFAFVVSRLSRADFMATYNLRPVSPAQWSSTGDSAWYGPDDVQICDYYYKAYETREIVQLPDGRVIPVTSQADLDPTWPRRKTRIPTVWWTQLCGQAILDTRRWKSPYIPVIRCEGERLDIDGKPQRTGMIQASMTPALQIDYYTSAETEAIALAPKAPWLVYAEQIAGYEGYWNRANDSYQPYLPHKAVVGPNGQMLPPPQRTVVEPAIQAITVAKQGAIEDMRATLGVYAPSMGEPGKERSGVAIQTQKIEGDQSTYHYPANLAWSIRACGVQLVELIRAMNLGPTQLRQVAKDGTVSHLAVNQPLRDGQGQPQMGEDGQQVQHMLARGQFDVVIDSGPSYSTQREQSVEKLGLLAQAQPDLARFFSDLWVSDMDVPHSEEISARLKVAVPPEALAATKDQNPATRVAQLQAQITQLGQQFQQVQQQLQSATQQSQVATQQLALQEQESARLRTQLADKQRSEQIDAQKAEWDHQEAMMDAQIKLRELELRYGMQAAQMQQDLMLETMPQTNGTAASEESTP
jgi:hypothetical protein